MDDKQTTSPFPSPPDYAKVYTEEKIKNGMYLPPPPVPLRYTVFNEEYSLEGPLLHSLSDVGIHQLYSSSVSWKSELKKLNRSVIAAFLDLIEILIQNPDHAERVEKIETIRLLFINTHHLINEYRPVQARDTLRQMIIRQNKEINTVAEKLNQYIVAGEKTIALFYKFLRNLQLDNVSKDFANSSVNAAKAS